MTHISPKPFGLYQQQPLLPTRKHVCDYKFAVLIGHDETSRTLPSPANEANFVEGVPLTPSAPARQGRLGSRPAPM